MTVRREAEEKKAAQEKAALEKARIASLKQSKQAKSEFQREAKTRTSFDEHRLKVHLKETNFECVCVSSLLRLGRDRWT